MVEDLWNAIRGGELALRVRSRYSLLDVRAALADAATSRDPGKVLIEG